MNTYLAVRASLNCFRTFILTGSGPACGDVSNLLPPSDPVKKGKGIFLIQENTWIWNYINRYNKLCLKTYPNLYYVCLYPVLYPFFLFVPFLSAALFHAVFPVLFVFPFPFVSPFLSVFLILFLFLFPVPVASASLLCVSGPRCVFLWFSSFAQQVPFLFVLKTKYKMELHYLLCILIKFYVVVIFFLIKYRTRNLTPYSVPNMILLTWIEWSCALRLSWFWTGHQNFKSRVSLEPGFQRGRRGCHWTRQDFAGSSLEYNNSLDW